MADADSRLIASRTVTVIVVVLGTLAALALVWTARTVLSWMLIAAFFAVALNPATNWVQRRLVRRRAGATLVVFLAGFVVLCGLGALIVVPLLDELARFADQVPDLVRETKEGRGPVVALLERLRVRQHVEAHTDQLQNYVRQLGRPTVDVLRTVAEGVAGVLTVVVLAYLMVVEAPRITARTVAVAGQARAERMRRIATECSRIVTGYVTGNLLISLVIGLATFVVLLLTGVPFAAVIALLVAIADLIPLVGATLGGIVAVGAGFLHSPAAGVIVLIFYVVYQQVENHLLQPVIMGRTVRLNPLTVLIAVLLGVQVGGLLGALLAIPAAGIVQVLLREFIPAVRRTGPAGATNDRPGVAAETRQGATGRSQSNPESGA